MHSKFFTDLQDVGSFDLDHCGLAHGLEQNQFCHGLEFRGFDCCSDIFLIKIL